MEDVRAKLSEREITRAAFKSVLRPGVELGVDDGSVSVINRLGDVARGDIAGYNASVRGSHRQLFPRLSRKDYEKMRYVDLPDSPVTLESLLAQVPGLRPQDIREFSSARRLARQTMDDGTVRDIVVPNITHPVKEVDLADYDELGGLDIGDNAGVKSRARKRTYTLTQVMSDQDVKAKFNLPARLRLSAERLAATDAPAAAAVYQEAMNAVQDSTYVTVVPGYLATDAVQASSAIRMMAYGAPVAQSVISSEVVAGKIFMYSPVGSAVEWHVVGPLRRAAEVQEVHRVVCAQGPVLPSSLLAVDLVQLKIDIYDGKSYMEPVMQFNSAFGVPVRANPGLAPLAAREMTSRQRAAVAAMADRLLVVSDRHGRQMATAVRVTEHHALVNDHVYEADAACTIAGRRVSLKRRVARDVWSVESHGEASPWVCRDAEVGELAIVVYTVGGVVSCTSPVVVDTVYGGSVMTTASPDVVPGVSGGALVALRDMALLGIHSAVVGQRLLNYRFGPEQMEEVVEADDMSSVSRVDEPESFAAELVRRFSLQGLGPTFRTMSGALVPLVRDGQHCGVAVADGPARYTTLEAGLWETGSGGPGTSVAFSEDPSQAGLRRSGGPAVQDTPYLPLRRAPRLGEEAFVVSSDGELYVTKPAKVLHLYAGSRGFVLGYIADLDRPVAGGLVVAWDGAVLGLAGAAYSTGTPVGCGLECVPLARIDSQSSMARARGHLAANFAELSPGLWSDPLLLEVFGGEGGSPGSDALAVLGASVLAHLGAAEMRRLGLPAEEWAEVAAKVTSVENVAACVAAHRLGGLAVGGPGGGELGDDQLFKLGMSLVGAASEVQGVAVAEALCVSLGLTVSMDLSGSDVDTSGPGG